MCLLMAWQFKVLSHPKHSGDHVCLLYIYWTSTWNVEYWWITHERWILAIRYVHYDPHTLTPYSLRELMYCRSLNNRWVSGILYLIICIATLGATVLRNRDNYKEVESVLEWFLSSLMVINEGKWTYTWWRHQMEALSALLAICAGNSPASGEFPAQRPVTRSFDVCLSMSK